MRCVTVVESVSPVSSRRGLHPAVVLPALWAGQYHLERVLLSLERDEQKKIDVDALLVAFSMAVKGAVDDRLQCLFDLATESAAPEAEDEDDTREMTQPQLERLLGACRHAVAAVVVALDWTELTRTVALELLLTTYQIPSEKRVLPVQDAKYPFQQYKSATAHELLAADQQAQVDAKTLTAAEANERASYTFDAFAQIMRGKTVCLWGECFANSKKRMKN